MNIRIAPPCCYSAVGQKSNQEDTLFPFEGNATTDTKVFIVCDGMGGHENGEVASACVAETIGSITAQQPLCTTAEMQEAFERALQETYHQLDMLDKSESKRKMGTTLTFLALCTDAVLVAHIGDSRVYQLRPQQGVLFQTRDHSLVNDLVAAGELTEEQAKTYPHRNIITRAIQPHQEYPAKATFNVLTDVQPGDVFFLCSDGVIEKLEDDLSQFLLEGLPLKERMEHIQTECFQRETRDNNTAYLIEITEVGDVPVKENNLSDSSLQENDTKMKPVTPVGKSYIKWLCWLIVSLIIVAIAFTAYYLMKPQSSIPTSTTIKKEMIKKTIKKTISENAN